MRKPSSPSLAYGLAADGRASLRHLWRLAKEHPELVNPGETDEKGQSLVWELCHATPRSWEHPKLIHRRVNQPGQAFLDDAEHVQVAEVLEQLESIGVIDWSERHGNDRLVDKLVRIGCPWGLERALAAGAWNPQTPVFLQAGPNDPKTWIEYVLANEDVAWLAWFARWQVTWQQPGSPHPLLWARNLEAFQTWEQVGAPRPSPEQMPAIFQAFSRWQNERGRSHVAQERNQALSDWLKRSGWLKNSAAVQGQAAVIVLLEERKLSPAGLDGMAAKLDPGIIATKAKGALRGQWTAPTALALATLLQQDHTLASVEMNRATVWEPIRPGVCPLALLAQAANRVNGSSRIALESLPAWEQAWLALSRSERAQRLLDLSKHLWSPVLGHRSEMRAVQALRLAAQAMDVQAPDAPKLVQQWHRRVLSSTFCPDYGAQLLSAGEMEPLLPLLTADQAWLTVLAGCVGLQCKEKVFNEKKSERIFGPSALTKMPWNKAVPAWLEWLDARKPLANASASFEVPALWLGRLEQVGAGAALATLQALHLEQALPSTSAAPRVRL